MSDLQPYSCTFENCTQGAETYSSRELFKNHELESHVLHETACPFCREQVPVAAIDERERGRHVGRHMEEIAFAVVPKPYEDWEFYSDSSKNSAEEKQTKTVYSTGDGHIPFFGIPYPSHGTFPPRSPSFDNGPYHRSVSSSSAAQRPCQIIQIITIDNDQGPIQLPIAIQAASKVANEKRKCNAAAVYRFRRLMRKKQLETSQKIDRLESQISYLTAEKDFYRQERDYFRSLVSRDSGQPHLPARPPSPR
ncbi:MAG: hypothetical protein Q9169_007972 [Polycauliona sp. 2 TL-2023]